MVRIFFFLSIDGPFFAFKDHILIEIHAVVPARWAAVPLDVRC